MPHENALRRLGRQAPTTRNQTAIDAWRLKLSKYEEAFKKQMEVIDAGFEPEDIMEYM